MVSYGSLLCSRIHLQREKVKHKAGSIKAAPTRRVRVSWTKPGGGRDKSSPYTGARVS